MFHFPCCPNIVLSVGYPIRGENPVYISPEIVALALIGLLTCAYILLIALFIGVVDAKGHNVASWGSGSSVSCSRRLLLRCMQQYCPTGVGTSPPPILEALSKAPWRVDATRLPKHSPTSSSRGTDHIRSLYVGMVCPNWGELPGGFADTHWDYFFGRKF